ncbi:MAG: class I SAM-dependent methyltransferase [Patescibacteria group bacterium]
MTLVQTASSAVAAPDLHKKAKASGYFRTDCRLCHSTALETFLDFGMHPHSDGFVRTEKLKDPEPVYPLAVNLCTGCGQVQISYVVKPEILYGSDDYLYDGAITETGRKHFLKMAKDIVREFSVASGSLAVDVGSNVGLLLAGFRSEGMIVQGVDPTPRMTKIAIENGLDTMTECFSSDAARRIVKAKGKASIITGTNVIAHIDDLDDLMEGIDLLLEDRGVFVIEAPHLLHLIEKLEFDTIYHQHLSYFSVKPMTQFALRFGMELFDAREADIHGGSLRFFIGRKGAHPVQPSIARLMEREEQMDVHSLTRLERFSKDVNALRHDLVTMLQKLKDQGYRLAGVGAPAKGSTLLNFCGINSSILEFVTEKNALKVGRWTPGTHIAILSDAELLRRQPDYALILPWNFAPEIRKNLQAFTDAGGRFILPLPTPKIL